MCKFTNFFTEVDFYTLEIEWNFTKKLGVICSITLFYSSFRSVSCVQIHQFLCVLCWPTGESRALRVLARNRPGQYGTVSHRDCISAQQLFISKQLFISTQLFYSNRDPLTGSRIRKIFFFVTAMSGNTSVGYAISLHR
jgi:hypothetical protein